MRRRRACIECSHRYTTYERLEVSPVLVLKRDGSTEAFDADKIARGVSAAAKNRPVEPAAVAGLVCRVEERLEGLADPVPSAEIGRLVLSELRCLDEVAYLRFASVYKEFGEVGDFLRELDALGHPAES